MPTPSFDIDFEPDTRFLVQDFQSLGANIRSLKPALEGVVRNIMVPAIKHNFDTESAAGTPWKSLSDNTIAYKQASGYGNKKKLVRTGKFRRKATSQNSWEVNADSATFKMNRLPNSSGFPYGMAHQLGVAVTSGMFSNTSIPARPWVVMDQATQDQVYSFFEYWVQLRVNQAMRRRGGQSGAAGRFPVFTAGLGVVSGLGAGAAAVSALGAEFISSADF